jgi:hypothetical protein
VWERSPCGGSSGQCHGALEGRVTGGDLRTGCGPVR